MAHPNADLVRKGVEAMIAGDMATVGEMIADDAKFHWPGTGSMSGDVEGKEAILAMMSVMPEGMTWQADVHAVLADDEHAVVLLRNTVGKGGETLLLDVVQVFHIADGKLIEGWGAPMDRAVFEKVWG